MRQASLKIVRQENSSSVFWSIYVPAYLNPSGKAGKMYFSTRGEAENKRWELLAATRTASKITELSNPQIRDAQRALERLAEAGLRQKDLAEHTNVREQTLSRYKTGERIPDTYELYRIAVALGVSIDWLLGIDSPTDSSTSPLTPTVREAKLTEKLAIATAGLEAILAELKKQ